MNTPRTIQTRRTRPKSGFRKLHAATRKRKQRASTTASPEDLGEVPGVGVPLALVVILLLHIAAIAGIWIHDRWSANADLAAVKEPLQEDVQPKRVPDLDAYLVESGDTAESIAKAEGVGVAALIRVNDGISEYQPGWSINLPPRKVEEPAAPVVRAPVVEEPDAVAYGPTERPLIQTSDEDIIPQNTPGELAEVGTPEAEAGRTDEAVLIRPVAPVRRDEPAPTGASSVHVVQKGETLWRIARNHGISVDQLMQANPNVDPSTLKIGAELVVPGN